MSLFGSRSDRDIAVIDVGSNSVRLVLFRLEGRALWPIFNEKVSAGLGRGMSKTGRLSEEGVETAARALKRFAALLDARKVKERYAVATAAVRSAEDGPDFVERVRAESGISIEVITGEEEARLSALGVLATVGVFLTLRPLRRLTAGVRRLGRGDWSQRIAPSGSGREDEVNQLAREFNSMAEALQERERRLLRGERLAAAGQLAAQITHEIRNPLSSVALNAELLEDELAEASPEARSLLAKISREVDRLTAVTEDYLSFARRPKPERSRIDLVEELTDLLDFMAQELEMAGIEVVRRLPPGPVIVLGDANQLRQVFMNLVRNAQEAVLELDRDRDRDRDRDQERRPRIEVEMRCKDDQVFVVVGDDGPGIPLGSAEVERIFDAFYTSKAQGTGLGLPTVQQIVQDHDGAVRVAHTGPEGTSFEVRLPACAPDGGSVSSPAPGAT